MSEAKDGLPAGWCWSTLGNAFEWGSGGTPKSDNNAFYGGEIPWATIGDLTDGVVIQTSSTITEQGFQNSSTKWVEPGSVLLAMYGSIGKLGLASRPMTTNQAIAFAKPNALSERYLFWYLRWRRADLFAAGKGGTQRNISQTVIKQFPFLVAPLPEQHRIAAEIEKQLTRLDAAIVALKSAQVKLTHYRASVLKSACEGRLVPTEAELAHAEGRDYEPADVLLERVVKERRAKWEAEQLEKMRAAGKEPKDDRWKAKYKEPAPPDVLGLAKIPHGWVCTTLEQISPIFVDCAHRTPKYCSTGFHALRPRDVVGGRLNLDGAARVDRAEFEEQTKRRVPRPGDIAYSRELSYGWGAKLLPGQTVCLSQGMVLLRPHPELDSDFYLILLNGPIGRRQAERAATGSAHPHINLKDIKAYIFPLAPKEEQKRIVSEVDRRISVIRKIESSVETYFGRATRLRQSILKRAFEGKLVPQDPNDEPASVLLERIRAEREQEDAVERPKRKRRTRSKAN